MSDSGLDNTIARTPDQARADIARKERERWYPGRDTAGGAIILSAVTGRSVALVGTEADRDFLVLAAQSFYLMRDALVQTRNILDRGLVEPEVIRRLSDDLNAALKAAARVTP